MKDWIENPFKAVFAGTLLLVFVAAVLALGIGVAFAWGIRRPWVQQLDGAGCATTKLVGAASIMVWFTVAATGRWIGFSG